MTETVELNASDGHVLSAQQASPSAAPRGALVVAQDAYGLGAYLSSVCDFYASKGYVTIAPALYDRQSRNALFDHSPEGRKESARFRSRLDWDLVMLDVEAARRSVERFGRVGVIGFCVGGSVAWLAAGRLPFAAAACYYGKDIVDLLEERPRCRTILHYADSDHLISRDDVAKAGRAYPSLEIFTYPGGHGFDAARRPDERASSELARSRCLDFFARMTS